MKSRKCRWNCGRMTERRCFICLSCIKDRDERNRRIDLGLAAYIPPSKRPGHRFFEGRVKKPPSEAQLAHLRRLHASRNAH